MSEQQSTPARGHPLHHHRSSCPAWAPPLLLGGQVAPSSQRFFAYPLRNASRSALIWSLCVEPIPWSKPGEICSVEPLTSLEESMAEAPIGTIWSSSPCMMSVGTSIFLRSSVQSVSENALMQSITALKPACIPCSQNASRRPCDTGASGRLAP